MSKKHRQKAQYHEHVDTQPQAGEDKKSFSLRKAVPVFLVVSLVANITFVYHLYTHKDMVLEKYEQYKFLSKRVFLESPNDIILNFVPLRKALREYVTFQEGRVGVYFEYLPSGISIGVNDREEVQLASLSKVPLAMAILKKVEKKKFHLKT